MHSLSQSFAVLTAVIPLVLGQGATEVTTSTLERTFTAYATSQPASVSTIHVTKILDTTTLTSTSRVTTTSPIRFTTVVPYTYLSTVNVTSTYRATTDVFTSTSTSTEYDIQNRTSTSYINVTATANTTVMTESLVTVPTPSSFVPVEESSGDEDYDGTVRRSDTEAETDILLPRQGLTPTPDTSYISLISIVTRLVPRTTSTVFVTLTKTSTQRPPRTVTESTTIAVTSTVGVPDVPVSSTVIVTAATTVNLTQTITVPAETTVSTVTNTQYNYTAVRSTYLACATDNLLGPRIQDGSYINNVVDNVRANVGTGTNATSSYECCTICQDVVDGFCDFAYFDTQTSAEGGNCVLYKANVPRRGTATCARAQAGFFNTNRRTANRWVVMNGPCGQLVHGNPSRAASTTAAVPT
ncbi:hypothetical protein AYO21_01324 [Fonsecaea monophora]|uniref:Apple domain-containing protein n=1 Tax=Fonsecaea monophora TaxID=254056 RepID=A0A177FJB3_9EURO|nr:hypothetical protein AYO21_01324 [Fonsecaea monophora]OAG44328.1 hypothetical protein AYO21_01324 [Fonsecaea monophora]